MKKESDFLVLISRSASKSFVKLGPEVAAEWCMLVSDTMDIVFVVSESHESIKAILCGLKLVFCILSALQLIRPCCLISEIKTDNDWIFFKEEIAPTDIRIGSYSVCDKIWTCVETMKISASEELIHRVLAEFSLCMSEFWRSCHLDQSSRFIRCSKFATY